MPNPPATGEPPQVQLYVNVYLTTVPSHRQRNIKLTLSGPTGNNLKHKVTTCKYRTISQQTFDTEQSAWQYLHETVAKYMQNGMRLQGASPHYLGPNDTIRTLKQFKAHRDRALIAELVGLTQRVEAERVATGAAAAKPPTVPQPTAVVIHPAEVGVRKLHRD